ncbi:HTTM domain-containing protein [Kordia jejudonensis]|uniref:HTTM domain-containing protein n=1 Tax=Kordia jejudonensis TaxID=1348245 RepID=UPI00062973F8|nr:HTTM domain-containing protein [Kordia jejudonensis]
MFAYLQRKIAKSYTKKIDAAGVSLFRILFSLTMLGEIIQLFYFRHLIFDAVPFIHVAEINFGLGLLVWMAVLVFMIIGYQTKIASILNYVLTLVFLGTIHTFEYHMFYAYLGITFLMMFMPLERKYSLHNYLKKRAAQKTGEPYQPNQTVSQLHYIVPLLVGVGFVYFDSIFFKLTSYNWMNGLGMWLPASLPMISHADNSFLMNIKWLALFLGYFTVLFEFIFIFLFWRKKWRLPMFIIGFMLHLGILIEFPIPWFGLGIIAIYLLLVPVSFWKYLEQKIGKKVVENQVVTPEVNEKQTIKYISYGLLALCLMQCNATYRSPLIKQFTEKSGFEQTTVGNFIGKVSDKAGVATRIAFGITKHGVFMDAHFDDYNHIVSVQYIAKDGTEIWLPIVNEDGMPESYIYGANWVKWTFRVVGTNVNNYYLTDGIKDFTAFWAHKNNVDLNDARFTVKVKKVETPREWKKDFLHKQQKKPWIDAGEVIWKSKKFEANIVNVESL